MVPHADSLEFRLLNDFQRDFPLVGRPFALLGERLGAGEEDVLAILRRLIAEGRVSRVGAVFAPNRLGASTLAALALPEDRLEAVAARISARPEVNHNYRREHAYNLWFVATAADPATLQAVLDGISAEAGLPVLSLPLEKEYHIDLGFDLAGHRRPERHGQGGAACELPGIERRLAAALQSGLLLVPRPFAEVAESAGLHEAAALERIGNMLDSGLIKRFGVVVRHHELGWRANAMCVWDVPDGLADELGVLLAREPAVTLCYRRRRGERERLAGWPHNLFCMIHGRERRAVEDEHAGICHRLGLGAFPGQVLFSTRRFKQCGARYGEGHHA